MCPAAGGSGAEDESALISCVVTAGSGFCSLCCLTGFVLTSVSGAEDESALISCVPVTGSGAVCTAAVVSLPESAEGGAAVGILLYYIILSQELQ